MGCGRGYVIWILLEMGPPVGVQKCFEEFTRRCIDYLGRQYIPKFNNTNAESVLTTVGITPLLVELIGMQ